MIATLFTNGIANQQRALDKIAKKVDGIFSILLLEDTKRRQTIEDIQSLQDENDELASKNKDADLNSAVVTDKKWKSVISGYYWMPLLEAILSYRAISFLLGHLVSISNPWVLLVCSIFAGYAILFIGKSLIALILVDGEVREKGWKYYIIYFSSFAPALIIPVFYWLCANYSDTSNVVITLVLSLMSAVIHIRLIHSYEKYIQAKAHIHAKNMYDKNINVQKKMGKKLQHQELKFAKVFLMKLRPKTNELLQCYNRFRTNNPDTPEPTIPLSNKLIFFINYAIYQRDVLPYERNEDGTIKGAARIEDFLEDRDVRYLNYLFNNSGQGAGQNTLPPAQNDNVLLEATPNNTFQQMNETTGNATENSSKLNNDQTPSDDPIEETINIWGGEDEV